MTEKKELNAFIAGFCGVAAGVNPDYWGNETAMLSAERHVDEYLGLAEKYRTEVLKNAPGRDFLMGKAEEIRVIRKLPTWARATCLVRVILKDREEARNG